MQKQSEIGRFVVSIRAISQNLQLLLDSQIFSFLLSYKVTENLWNVLVFPTKVVTLTTFFTDTKVVKRVLGWHQQGVQKFLLRKSGFFHLTFIRYKYFWFWKSWLSFSSFTDIISEEKNSSSISEEEIHDSEQERKWYNRTDMWLNIQSRSGLWVVKVDLNVMENYAFYLVKTIKIILIQRLFEKLFQVLNLEFNVKKISNEKFICIALFNFSCLYYSHNN